jgi:hypothetical protein
VFLAYLVVCSLQTRVEQSTVANAMWSFVDRSVSVAGVVRLRGRAIALALARPFGYLAFVIAVASLSVAGILLGEEHELGFFARRLGDAIRRYPEITRPGVQVAWVGWLVLLVIALSPVDPITSRWDEVVLVLLAAVVLWCRMLAARSSAR